jgi:Septum formation
MRRWWALVAGAAVALAVGGCTKPAGVDGDLTNQWPAFAKAQTPVPVVGACYPREFDPTWYGDFDSAVDCANASHQTETVFVGALTGADADRSAPPLAGSASRKAAYTRCQQAANDYLGDAWQTGKVVLGLVLPDDKAWTGGARWYRCDVIHFQDSDYNTVATTGSVKDGLRGARPVAVTCLIVTDDGKNSVTKTDDADCDKPHNGEFAGIYQAPDGAWPADENARRKLANNGCEAIVAHFLGYTGDQAISNYLGWMAQGFDENQWNLGDRSERCFALAFNGKSVNGARIIGSVKGLRGGAPRKA